MKGTRTVLHLSVDRDGVVSLWDEAEQAQRVDGEAYVALALTPEQKAKLTRARREAQRKERV